MKSATAHVALIRTPPVLPVSSVTAQQGVPSLALAYLGGALKQQGHQVTYIDALGERLGSFRSFGVPGLLFAGLSIPEILDRIPREIEVIGVSCQFSNDWIFSRRLLDEIHLRFPDKPIVIGGEHATADYPTIFETNPYIAACVLGEGEETLLELTAAFAEKKDHRQVQGIAYSENGEVKKTCGRKRNKALDLLPWPDWESLPVQNYLNAGLGMAAQGVRTMPMLGSRGCPYKCTFCSAPQMWSARWFHRSVDDVIQEAHKYKRLYGIEHIEFYDMSPSIDRKWFEELCGRLGELKLTWNFAAGMRSEILNPELLKNLHQNGCYKITYALETSAPKLIEMIKKKVKPNRVMSLVRSSVKAGIITKVNFIWGLPGQRVRDVLTDYLYLVRLAWNGLHDATCFAFVPYPGCEEFTQLKAAGKIQVDDKYEEFLAFNVYNNPLRMRSWSDHIQDRHLSYWTLGGMAVFYSVQFLVRPLRFVRLVHRLWTAKPVTMLELALFGLLNNFIKGRKLRTEETPIFESGVLQSRLNV
ncbi:B12-binding domain-containing radical SAM protein [bacterium]|nr:B12-binding domain-containing radical SAM protein [bacterium]